MDFSRQLSNIVVPRMSQDTRRFYFLMYQLQSISGLTYREARAVLRELHGDSVSDLAAELGCTTQAVYSFYHKGMRKAESFLSHFEDTSSKE